MGKRLKADKDSKYEAVTYNDEQYLINTSGKIHEKCEEPERRRRCVLLYR